MTSASVALALALSPALAIAQPAPREAPAPDAQPSQQPGAPSQQEQESDAPRPPPPPPPRETPRLGVVVTELSPELRQHFGAPEDRGVLVARVSPGSMAERAGIRVGDVIVEVRGTPVSSGEDVRQALRRSTPGAGIPTKVVRDGHPITLDAKRTVAPPPPMEER
ncbi:MAG: PDZ domain-containing protein [Deltaproteobacteria bacterium]|nr:PDZ domain-containing protein [Deltaproteobacteria bacterium]